MNIKTFLIGLGVIVSGFAIVNAAVDVGITSAGTSSQIYNTSRFSISKVGAEANSGSLSTTNVVQTVPGIVGKIVFVPGAVADVLTVYNATAGSGCSASAEVFKAQANSPTMANSPTVGFTAGAPFVYDLMPGWTCSSGITTIITRSGNTSTSSKAFISYDIPR
jgi:hypothetical protein